MSDEIKIPSKSPAILELAQGTYFWCTCGRSSNQPFCNGAHQGTSFVPMRFDQKKDGRVVLCNCKHTANKPFCDGAHAKLS